MTRQQLEDVQNVIGVLGCMADRAGRLRENPGHATGRARRSDLRCNLEIIEQGLQVAADALRKIVEEQGDGNA